MKTDAHAHSQLDSDFGNGTPATLYIGFTTTLPSATAAGTEPSGNGYARIAVTNNSTNFPAAASRQKKLATAVETAVATGGNIGTIYGLNFWDASSSGSRKRFALLSDAFGYIATALATNTRVRRQTETGAWKRAGDEGHGSCIFSSRTVGNPTDRGV